VLFEQAPPAEAERVVSELVRRAPADAAAHHNLGTIRLRLKRYPAAVQAYRDALGHRADAPTTQLHLGYALKECGRLEEAVAAWEEVLPLAPGDPAATAELQRAVQLSGR
jgi:Flp pilus assembly protein TadD